MLLRVVSFEKKIDEQGGALKASAGRTLCAVKTKACLTYAGRKREGIRDKRLVFHRELEVNNPVPFWGQVTKIPSNLSPSRDCGPKRG